MDKILLFPHGCRKIGWGLFIPAALLGVLMLFDGLNGFPSFLLPGAAEAGETLDAVCNNTVIVGLLAGTLLIACSRERIEDEGIGRIRLNALLAALYANCAAVAAAGGQYLRGYILDCCFAGLHFCFSGYFCAIGRSELSFLHNITAVVLVRVPGAYLMSKWFPTTLLPMGLATAAGSLLSVIICVIAFLVLRRRGRLVPEED